MAIDWNAGVRRARRKLRHLPRWSKVAAGALCAVVTFCGVAAAVGSTAVHPEEPASVLGDVDDAQADTGAEVAIAAPADAAAAEQAMRATLDGASGTKDVNLFDATGAQRVVEASETPAIAAALEAFGAAGSEAGFIVYDFATQRGLGYHADVECFSASTIKAPFVAYVLQDLVDAGAASLTDEVRKDVIMEGTGVMATDGVDIYDLETVLADTIVYSDNTGYALLRDGYGDGFEAWAEAAGANAAAWEGEWYPYYTPRDLAKLWLGVGSYLRADAGQAAFLKDLLSRTGTSFIRQALGADHEVLAKAGYEIDTPLYDMGALNDAGIVKSDAGDYLVVIMSDADYDDEYFLDNEPLILNLITALDEAHDRLLAA